MSYNILAPGNNGLVLGTATNDFTVQSSGVVLVTTGNLDQVLYLSRNSESDKTENSFAFDLTEGDSSFIVSGTLGTIGTHSVTGDLAVSGNIDITGTAEITSTLSVGGISHLDDIRVTYDADDILYISASSGKADISTNDVTDYLDIKGWGGINLLTHTGAEGKNALQLTTSQNVLIPNGNVYVTGSLNTSGTLSINGTSTFEDDITVNANVTATNVITTSDERLKTNILDFTNQVDINKFRPVEFNWKKSPEGKKVLGFIAQEICVNNPDMVYEDERGNLGIDYIQIIPVLTKNIQKFNVIVKQQQERIAELEKRL